MGRKVEKKCGQFFQIYSICPFMNGIHKFSFCISLLGAFLFIYKFRFCPHLCWSSLINNKRSANCIKIINNKKEKKKKKKTEKITTTNHLATNWLCNIVFLMTCLVTVPSLLLWHNIQFYFNMSKEMWLVHDSAYVGFWFDVRLLLQHAHVLKPSY